MTIHKLLDILTERGVIVEATAGDGRVKLRALFDDQPLSSEIRDLCREHRDDLIAYANFTKEATALMRESNARIARQWSLGSTALDDDTAWDDLERQVHRAFWTLDMDALHEAIKRREAYALSALGAYRPSQRKEKTS